MMQQHDGDPCLPQNIVRPTISIPSHSRIMEMASPQRTPQSTQISSPFSGIGGAFSPPKKRQRKYGVSSMTTATNTPLAPVCDKTMTTAIYSCPLLPLIPLSLCSLGNLANTNEKTWNHMELAKQVGHRLFLDNQPMLRSLFVDAVIKCHEEFIDDYKQINRGGIRDHEVSADGDDIMMHHDMHDNIRLMNICRPLYDETRKSISDADADADDDDDDDDAVDNESFGLSPLDLCYCAWTIMMLGKYSICSNSNSHWTMNNR